jgi:hypothetical protein
MDSTGPPAAPTALYTNAVSPVFHAVSPAQ